MGGQSIRPRKDEGRSVKKFRELETSTAHLEVPDNPSSSILEIALLRARVTLGKIKRGAPLGAGFWIEEGEGYETLAAIDEAIRVVVGRTTRL